MQICAVICSWLLVLSVMKWKHIAERKILAVPFMVSFVFSVLNLAAPGNFVRSEETWEGGNLGLLEAIKDTFICFFRESKNLFLSPVFIVILVTVFLISFFLFKEEMDTSLYSVIVSGIGGLVTQFLCIFPVTFGYHASELGAGRTNAAYLLTARFSYIFFIAVLGMWLGKKNIQKKYIPSISALLIGGILIIFASSGSGDFGDGSYFGALNSDIRSKAMKNNYEVREYMLSTLAVAKPEDDVIVWARQYDTKSAYGMGLGIDSSNFVNQAAAHMFDVNSFTVLYTDEEGNVVNTLEPEE